MLGPLFRTAGHKVRTQFGVTATAGQRRGDVQLKIRDYLRDAAGSWSLVLDLSITHNRYGGCSHPQNDMLTHPQDLNAPLRPAQREVNAYRQQLTTRTSSFPPLAVPHHSVCTAIFGVFFFYRLTGKPRSTAFTAIGPLATQLGQDRVLPRSLLSRTKEQSQTRCGQIGGVEHQPEYRVLCRRRTPSARSLARSPSPRHTPITQYPLPPRPLVCGGQTSPHRPRLVVSHRSCPPLSSSISCAQLSTRS
jgi:hypothetical protein